MKVSVPERMDSAAGKTKKKLPVAMWVHGGGYNAGWGFEPEMDGEAWAKEMLYW